MVQWIKLFSANTNSTNRFAAWLRLRKTTFSLLEISMSGCCASTVGRKDKTKVHGLVKRFPYPLVDSARCYFDLGGAGVGDHELYPSTPQETTWLTFFPICLLWNLVREHQFSVWCHNVAVLRTETAGAFSVSRLSLRWSVRGVRPNTWCASRCNYWNYYE